MPGTALLNDTLSEQQMYLLALITPGRVCSERDADDAPIRIRVVNVNPRRPERRLVTRDVRHFRDLGLVARDGVAWTRTPAGDRLIKKHIGGK